LDAFSIMALRGRFAAFMILLALLPLGLKGGDSATSKAITQGVLLPAARSFMNINGKHIVVDNISSASNSRVNSLVAIADQITSSGGLGTPGLMQPGDRIVVTSDYLAWLDNTRNTTSLPGDRYAGGMLRGLWHLTNSGENLNFRTDGAWNELLPYYYSAGTGYELFLNENSGCADISFGVFTSAEDPVPATTIDGGPSPYFAGGVRYQYQGHFWNRTNSTYDIGAGSTLRYTVTYDFGPGSSSFDITTTIDRDSGSFAPTASCLSLDYDVVSAWTAGYAPNSYRIDRLNNASYARVCQGTDPHHFCEGSTVSANQLADLPNDQGVTSVEYWINQPGSSLGAGSWQYLEEWPDGNPPRFLATANAYTAGNLSAFQDEQTIYNPSDVAYSLIWNAFHNVPTLLPLGWSMTTIQAVWTM
jgi:hypothetical protein